MDYGLYISASGALHSSYKQDVLSGNLANLNTPGFKPHIALTMQRDPARIEDGLGALPSNELLERLSAGVLAAPSRLDMTQGSIRATGNDLDLAIEGDGFFVLLDESDSTGNRLRLTRDGRFTLDERGRLISVTSGMPAAGPQGRPIVLDRTARITVRPDGAILQNGEETARLEVADVPNRESLVKERDGRLIGSPAQMASRRAASGRIAQGAIEDSAVNEITMLIDMQSAANNAQANIGMIAYHDRLLDQAINRFARVA